MKAQKNIDVTARTLEKDKKEFSEFCKFGELCSIVVLTLLIITAILSIITVIMSATGFVNDPELTAAQTAYIYITYLLYTAGIVAAVNFTIKIFSKLKTAETPFSYDIADKIKALGCTLFITGMFGVVSGFISFLLTETGVFIKTDELDSVLNSDVIIFGAFLMALAYIFNYGCKLQQESDETL